MGTKPGTIKRFTPEDVKSIKKPAHQSLHEADILKILALAKHLRQYPQQLIIFGIEPEKIELGQNLSKTLKEKLDDYVAEISEELNLQSTEKIVINSKRPLKHSDRLDKKAGRNQS
jgi:hydrogenase maturation protease